MCKHVQINIQLNKPLLLVLSLAILLPVTGCFQTISPESGVYMSLDEPFRLQYHFTPPQQWMNDPNGLVYYDGEYHLFYQHNPNDTVWGPMHWGHAVSTDLVNWTHLPIALEPDEIGAIFSGSAVVDWQNTAGFGREALVAIFTHDGDGRQSQSLAYSTDNGRTWAKYEGNPVIQPPHNIRNFRDPKVFWYNQDAGSGHWVMSVSAGSMILFFTSPDLKNWESSGGFGLTYGATCGVWETPDLFELPINGGPQTRWVLGVAVGDCASAGGSGMQYFVGQFDGQTFTSDNDKETILWADFGADFYAPQSWGDAPNGRRIWIGWMDNWQYAQQIPTSVWRGAMTIPRELDLVNTTAGIRLRQRPLPELQQLRGALSSWDNETITAATPLSIKTNSELLEIIAEFTYDLTAADRLGLRLHIDDDNTTTIGYTTKNQTLYIDRTHSGQTDFNAHFPAVHTAVMEPLNGLIRLHLFVDRSSIELFGNDGLVNFTERIFPSAGNPTVEIFVDGGQATLNSLEIYELTAAEFYTAVTE